VIVLIAYPVAYLVHRYVEKPGIELGKRFIGKRPSAAQPRKTQTPPVSMPEAAIEASS
jgi:peptidoglycan/LPS O-acetylase OafA/YrhL